MSPLQREGPYPLEDRTHCQSPRTVMVSMRGGYLLTLGPLSGVPLLAWVLLSRCHAIRPLAAEIRTSSRWHSTQEQPESSWQLMDAEEAKMEQRRHSDPRSVDTDTWQPRRNHAEGVTVCAGWRNSRACGSRSARALLRTGSCCAKAQSTVEAAGRIA